MVNRVWKHVFGAGIVRTPDDFGVYGAEPTHRELLDYLAERFVGGGWSVKRLIRELVTSHAFRQSSRGSEGIREKDPDNEMVMRYERPSGAGAVVDASGASVDGTGDGESGLEARFWCGHCSDA